MKAKELKHGPNTNPPPTYPRPPVPPAPPRSKPGNRRAFFDGIKELADDLRGWCARNPRPIYAQHQPLPPKTPAPTMRYTGKEPKV
jgi:hypothetical protein